jgi:type IV secretory pathway VirB2 component (pilin)
MKILSNLAQLLNANTVNIPNGTADQVIGIILNLTYLVAGIIAVIIVIVAGFRITVASDSATISKARNSIIHAVIAIVIILSAFTITHFIIGRF